jgi:hypothetical protein
MKPPLLLASPLGHVLEDDQTGLDSVSSHPSAREYVKLNKEFYVQGDREYEISAKRFSADQTNSRFERYNSEQNDI